MNCYWRSTPIPTAFCDLVVDCPLNLSGSDKRSDILSWCTSLPPDKHDALGSHGGNTNIFERACQRLQEIAGNIMWLAMQDANQCGAVGRVADVSLHAPDLCFDFFHVGGLAANPSQCGEEVWIALHDRASNRTILSAAARPSKASAMACETQFAADTSALSGTCA